MEMVYGLMVKYELGCVCQFDEDYFKKVEVIEFVVKYDDGRDLRGILKVDIILFGVFRMFKILLF